jgi:hypothetical protein
MGIVAEYKTYRDTAMHKVYCSHFGMDLGGPMKATADVGDVPVTKFENINVQLSARVVQGGMSG